MTIRAVLDSTVVVSAFLTPEGAADVVLQSAVQNRFTCIISDYIIDETIKCLLSSRLQQRYRHSAADVKTYGLLLRSAFELVTDIPPLTGIVRDPGDDMIIACAIAASASHIVTRDNDLLSMGTYEGIAMITPEGFLARLRR